MTNLNYLSAVVVVVVVAEVPLAKHVTGGPSCFLWGLIMIGKPLLDLF